MVVVKLLFKIVDTFGLMDADDQEAYLAKAKQDWDETNLRDVDNNEVKHEGFKGILAALKKLERNWLFAMGVSIASIFIIRAIGEYMRPSNPVDELREGMR